MKINSLTLILLINTLSILNTSNIITNNYTSNTRFLEEDNTIKDKIIHNVLTTNNQNCEVVVCQDSFCSTIGGTCIDNPNYIKDGIEKICKCKQEYSTLDGNSRYKCCYERYKGLVSLLLEVFIGFGIGHYIRGSYDLANIKCAFYFSLLLFFILYYFKLRKIPQKTFILKLFITSIFILGLCLYAFWQVTDLILFTIGFYKDENGIKIYI